MTNTQPKTKEAERPWMLYRKPDGSREKLYEPGWAGVLNDDEVERLQNALAKDSDLAYWWGWRPSTRRRSVSAIMRVAMSGNPDNRGHNVGLVRAASRRPTAGDESPSPKVKKDTAPLNPRLGRPHIESWESELLRMASLGMGLKSIAKALRGQGVQISHTTVATRLRELKGQLTLIS
jgi:hypothetical protein